jgi:hypothetical protein
MKEPNNNYDNPEEVTVLKSRHLSNNEGDPE